MTWRLGVQNTGVHFFCLNCDFYDSIGGKHQANMNLAAAES
jgi:hypothetical protein